MCLQVPKPFGKEDFDILFHQNYEDKDGLIQNELFTPVNDLVNVNDLVK